MVVPDYQMLEYVERIASNLSNDPVLFWPLILPSSMHSLFNRNYHDV